MTKTKSRLYLSAAISLILGLITFGFSKTTGVAASIDTIWLTDKLPVMILVGCFLIFLSAVLFAIAVSVKR